MDAACVRSVINRFITRARAAGGRSGEAAAFCILGTNRVEMKKIKKFGCRSFETETRL